MNNVPQFVMSGGDRSPYQQIYSPAAAQQVLLGNHISPAAKTTTSRGGKSFFRGKKGSDV